MGTKTQKQKIDNGLETCHRQAERYSIRELFVGGDIGGEIGGNWRLEFGVVGRGSNGYEQENDMMGGSWALPGTTQGLRLDPRGWKLHSWQSCGIEEKNMTRKPAFTC